MNAAESKALKKGSRVYWRGNVDDSGRVTDNELGRGHNCLRQRSRGDRTSWGYARNPASADEAGYCVRSTACVIE
jgi:hypothetical protein